MSRDLEGELRTLQAAVNKMVPERRELLNLCKMTYHTLSSLLAVREGIPDDNLREQIARLHNAYQNATGESLP